MEVESSTGITEGEREIALRTKETRSSARKKKGSRIIISSGEEEVEISVFIKDETPRKRKRRGIAGKQRRKVKEICKKADKRKGRVK